MVPDGLLRKLVQIYPLGADMSLISMEQQPFQTTMFLYGLLSLLSL